MSKIYFEMNDKERQLHHIAEGLDYAICTFGEGLSGTGEFTISTDEVIELQSRIVDQLINANDNIKKLSLALDIDDYDED